MCLAGHSKESGGQQESHRMQPENSRQESDMVYFIYLFSEALPNRFPFSSVGLFSFRLPGSCLPGGLSLAAVHGLPRSVAPRGVEWSVASRDVGFCGRGSWHAGSSTWGSNWCPHRTRAHSNQWTTGEARAIFYILTSFSTEHSL